ncbi:MAG: Cna B-type domain-containing protein, partial [Clostridiales bacterium]|nr:Cna B-type domain-containing protein [Clostridiales bacterium]
DEQANQTSDIPSPSPSNAPQGEIDAYKDTPVEEAQDGETAENNPQSPVPDSSEDNSGLQLSDNKDMDTDPSLPYVGKDRSDLLKIIENNLLVQENNEDIYVIYDWLISVQSIQLLHTEDYFLIDLPIERCSFSSSAPQILFDEKNTDIGTYEISDHNIRISLNQSALSMGHDLKGSLSIKGTALPILDEPPTLLLQQSEKKDVTEYITINPLSLRKGEDEYLIKDGVAQSDPPEIKNGDSLTLEYRWSVSAGNISNINPNDFFTVDLPAPVNLKGDEDKQIPILDSGGKEMGYYIISEGVLTATLNEDAVNREYLENGFFNISITAINDGEEDIKISIGDIEITIKPGTGGGGDNEQDTETPVADHDIDYRKSGQQMGVSNQLAWHISINYSNLKNKIEGKNVSPMRDVTLEDELSEGTKISDTPEFSIRTALYVPTSEGGMSGYSYTSLNLKPDFISSNNGESKEIFFERVKESGKTWPTVGVYGDNYIVWAFGDLPREDITYNSLASNDGAIEQLINNAYNEGIINDTQRDHMVKVYSNGAPVIAYDISFQVEVTKKGDNTYKNTAILKWSDDGKKSLSFSIQYDDSQGGVDGPEAKSILIKKSDDRGNILQGITFKLQKQSEDGSYHDYIPGDGKGLERATDENGEVVFERISSGHYKILEVNGPSGYGTPIYSPSDEFEITDADIEGITFNVINPEEVSISGKKNWEHGDNPTANYPTEITVVLLADGENFKSTTVTAKDNWEYSFTGLPKFKDQKEIQYTIDEIHVPNYNKDIQGNNLLNTYVPEEIEISGKKHWEHGDNPTANYPTEITVVLLADGKDFKSKTVTAENNWEYSFTGLPKFKDQKEIKYTIDEEDIPNYSKSKDGTNLINTYLLPEETSMKVKKVWVDEHNVHTLRPTTVEIQLYANDQAFGNPVTLSKNNQWEYLWNNLPKHTQNNQLIHYTVKEVKVPLGYAAKEKVISSTEVEITNYIPRVPKTGDETNLALYIGIMAGAIILISALIIILKKKRK